MPPKKETKKLTKKELLELKRAEEKKKQEEEQRIRDENEKKRLEEERIKHEYEQKLAEEERERLKEEYDGEVRSWESEYFLHLTKNEKRLKEMQDWEKTLKCDPMPDPEYEKELTAYITSYSDPIKMQNHEIKPVLESVQYAQEIISRLNTTLMKAYSDEDYKRVNWCKEYLLTLQNISNSKIDEATADLVLNNDVLITKKADQLKKQKDSQKTGKTDLQNQKIEIDDINHIFKDIIYGLWINPNSKAIRYKPVSFGETGIKVELPRALQMSTLIMRVFWNARDTFSKPDVYSKDIILGGVLDVVWYTLPPPPKPVGNIWTLKQEFDQEGALQRISYPSVDQMGQFTNATSFKVHYTLPPYVYLTQNDKIRVALWDAKVGWIHDNIEDIKYENDKKQLVFNTIRLAPFAFVQERATDFPYTSWKLRCVSEDRLFLDIQGKRQYFKFEIGAGYAVLRDRSESELAHLVNKKLPPYQLLSELSKCGIHLLPVDEDALTNGLTLKTKQTEDAAIRDICFAMRSFYIKSSRWNMQLNNDKIMVRIRENLEYDEEFAEDQEKDWKSICWWPNKCAVIKARESHESLNENFLSDTVAHANLELLLRKHELTESEATFRFREFKFIHFMQTVQRFFKLTRLLAFSLQ